jgi:hypothetical protein
VKNTSAQKHRHPALLHLDVADLAFASWETIAHRSWMMIAGECSPLEYQRMMQEKFEAACDSAFAFAFAPGPSAVSAALAPWTHRARANAQRLRTPAV